MLHHHSRIRFITPAFPQRDVRLGAIQEGFGHYLFDQGFADSWSRLPSPSLPVSLEFKSHPVPWGEEL